MPILGLGERSKTTLKTMDSEYNNEEMKEISKRDGATLRGNSGGISGIILEKGGSTRQEKMVTIPFKLHMDSFIRIRRPLLRMDNFGKKKS